MELFIKHNNTGFSDALLQEAKGLQALKDALNGQLLIPSVESVNQKELHLQKINRTSHTKEHSLQLAKGLAYLHRQPQKLYGFTEDNYIGLNQQKNSWSNEWGTFFVEQRLGFQISLIKDKVKQEQFFEQLVKVKEPLCIFLSENTSQASLVHGDLWSGNVLYSQEGTWLIDPAVYYGDREVDIAMSEMFGGFDMTFYDQYEKEYPKSKLYETKKIIYNLYHYLNHYNLFGFGYLQACEDSFNQIERIFR